jgi:PAS domain S-box-containing protein
MKRWFERLPIHRKLVASALLITAVALVIATLGLSAFDLWRFREAAAEDAGALARVIAENTAAAVMFNQADAAEDVLQSVRVRNVVTRACIFLPNGQLFASYTAIMAGCPATVPSADGWNGIYGAAVITRNGRTYGAVYVERNLANLQQRLLLTGLASVLMFGLAAVAAYVLAQRVNVAISRPIGDLANFARRFGDTPDVDLPPIHTAPDELGQLVTAFGEMVTRVQTANDELRRSNDALRIEKTERDAALVRQRESERRFKTLADGSPVLLWVNGQDGCEFVNRAYLDFVGLESDLEVRGFDWSRFVHPDDRDEYVDTYMRAFRSRSSFGAEFRFRRADGEWRWMRSEATPRLEDGVFAGYVGASVDITERRRAEDALREADQRKDAFLAILAHELRNPLAPIRTGVELLRLGGEEPGAMKRVLPVLDRQVAHMVRLIDDLLDMSRITSGKIQLQRQPTSLKDVVTGAIDANRAAIEAAGLHLTVKLPEMPCLLDVDPTRFVQVLSNVLNNATKFTDRGGQIGVSAMVDDNLSPPLLTLTITDSGAGIAASTLPRVFEFFVQGDTPGHGKSGLGIGLGLAKQLIEMHGGTIQAQSDGVGFGSSFTIRIPVITWEVVRAQANDDRSNTRPCVGRRVLVIDDNVDAADTLAALVVTLGGEAATAYNGLDGLKAAQEFRPDVVLLDIGMPKMDGYETCRRLRAQPFGQLYVVAVTGFGQLHDRDRALADGFDAHLTKPADTRVLEELFTDARFGGSDRKQVRTS